MLKSKPKKAPRYSSLLDLNIIINGLNGFVLQNSWNSSLYQVQIEANVSVSSQARRGKRKSKKIIIDTPRFLILLLEKQ